ncbi:MAG TPA: ATPase, T2SS/T4P/T4SS family, partial [Thermoanaerobaculia bacterium]|nr:ATPase, T2SS/T4P/T4SS family [Thermoanaerobaculia bacterium]
MTDQIRDPDLDELVRELNQKGASLGGGEAVEPEDVAPSASPAPATSLSEPLDRPAQARVEVGGALDRFLLEMIRQGASDLLLIAGLPPVFRLNGRLIRAEAEAVDGEDLSLMFRSYLGSRARRDLDERGSADFPLRLAPGREIDEGGTPYRFRVNLHRQRGQLAAAIRALPLEIPTLSGLNLPAAFAELVRPSRGLVLLCGPTGSGKSTTLAALVEEINRTRSSHVITIEDPVEYEHRSNKSIIEHVEIGRDARSFPEALRAALRQDPDVILVGEMRDFETVETALLAAETGHLVFSTLHTLDATETINRI